MQTDRYATALGTLATHAPDADEAVADEAGGAALFVVPNKRADGFRASIRGHMFELADPDSPHGLVPTPEDLLTVAIASDVAWFVRRFLRAHGLQDHVSVSARLRTSEGREWLGAVDVTVELSGEALRLGTALTSEVERRLSAHSSQAARLRIRRL